MNRFHAWAAVLGLCILTPSAARGQAPDRKPIVCVVRENYAYAIVGHESTRDFQIKRVSVKGTQAEQVAVLRGDDIHAASLRIAFDQLHVRCDTPAAAPKVGLSLPSLYRIPMRDLLPDKGAPPDVNTRDVTRFESLVAKPKPVADLANVKPAKAKLAYYLDFLPVSPKNVRLFLLCNVEPPRGLPPKEQIDAPEKWTFRTLTAGVPDGAWTEEEDLDVSFKEPFHVFADAGGYFMVTRSGKLYAYEKTPIGPRRPRTLWTDAKRPITHVLTDLAQNRTYAGGVFQAEPKGNARLFLFELSGRPGPHLISVGTAEPILPDDPMKGILQFASAVREVQGRPKKSDVPDPDKGKVLAGIENDPKLRVPVTVKDVDPDLRELLRHLQKKTGLDLIVDEKLKDHRPKLGDVDLRGVPAYAVMNVIARTELEGGRWEKTDLGYRLQAVAIVPIVKKIEPTPEQRAKDAQKAYEEELARNAKLHADFAKRHPLFQDLKCRATLNIEKGAKLADVMEKLRVATQLNLTLAENLVHHDPVLGFVDRPNAPAHWVMEHIATRDLDDGQWVKTDDGYRLEGTSRALRLPPKTYGWAWITGCVLGGLVIAGGAFAIYRRTLAARPTAGGSSP